MRSFLRAIAVGILAIPFAWLFGVGVVELHFLRYKAQNAGLSPSEIAEDKGLWVSGALWFFGACLIGYVISIALLWWVSRKLCPKQAA